MSDIDQDAQTNENSPTHPVTAVRKSTDTETAGTWSPAKKWWMDVAKYGVTFVLGAAASVAILDRFEDRRAADRLQQQTVLDLKMDAMRDFKMESMAYHRAALDAYVDVLRWQGGPKTSAMLAYEQAYDRYALVAEELGRRFADDHAVMLALDSLSYFANVRFGAYETRVSCVESPSSCAATRGEGNSWYEGHEAFEERRSHLISRLESVLIGLTTP